jgi:predicted O-methyltransferase YrrM
MSTLKDFYLKKNIKIAEGNIGDNNQQGNDIISILKTINPKNILEIGFNAGHSSEIFLKYSNAYVHSFDIGDHFHEYLKYGKLFINYKYPNRHTLIFGDSTTTIPDFSNNKNINNIKFDIIFIDGGHEYEIAYKDLINCRDLAHEKTIVIMDDIISSDEYFNYTVGPKKAWNQLISDNLLKEIKHSDYGPGRGQSVGIYNNL